MWPLSYAFKKRPHLAHSSTDFLLVAKHLEQVGNAQQGGPVTPAASPRPLFALTQCNNSASMNTCWEEEEG